MPPDHRAPPNRGPTTILAAALAASVGLNVYLATRPAEAPIVRAGSRAPAPAPPPPDRPSTAPLRAAPAPSDPPPPRDPPSLAPADDPRADPDAAPPAPVDARRADLPLLEIAHAQAMERWQDALRPLFAGPPAERTPEQAEKSRGMHMAEARAIMGLDDGEAERYGRWFDRHGAAVDAAHRSGDRAAHLDALIEMFVAEERFLADAFGPERAGRYLDARAEHRVFVLVGVASAADVDPYVALDRYGRAGGRR